MNDAQNTVATSFVVVGLSVYLGSLASGNRPSIRPVAGIAVGGFVLLAAAGGSGRSATLARQFSVLIATTAVLTSGFYAARALGRFFGGSLPTQSPTYEPGRLRD
jgi:hypothetical protein